ncbi:50S ribosomal protein mrp49 [Xylariaceae sp. FL0804]|nr:50S ribosomal protein mrp49 [Xylariaceae sp. FL0804]
MVNVGKRMHILQSVLALRLGPGAAILPSEVTRIHLDFAHKWNDGHLGPRKFWKDCLPRLKYWNPAVPMLVNRTTDQSGPATMSIYFRQAGGASSSSPRSTATTTTTTSSSSSSSPTEAATAAEGESSPPSAPTPAPAKKPSATAAAVQAHSSSTGAHPAPAPRPDERVETVDMKGQRSEAILAELLARTRAQPVQATPAEEAELRGLEQLARQAVADRETGLRVAEARRERDRLAELALKEAEAIRQANQ